MSVQDVYNFDKVFGTAIGNLCASLGLTAFSYLGKHTLNQDGSFSITTPDLQRDRPRVEVIFTKGGSATPGRLAIVNPGDDFDLHRQQAWLGNFDFTAVTDAQPDVHYTYLATIRNFVATLPYQLNTAVNGVKIYLPNHHLHAPMVDAGETHRWDTKAKFFLSTIRVSGQFSILASAWPLLTSP